MWQVCEWAAANISRNLVVSGSSAGSCVAGSALPRLGEKHKSSSKGENSSNGEMEGSSERSSNSIAHTGQDESSAGGNAVDGSINILAYIGIGYTFGFWASVLFGGHFRNVLDWPVRRFLHSMLVVPALAQIVSCVHIAKLLFLIRVINCLSWGIEMNSHLCRSYMKS